MGNKLLEIIKESFQNHWDLPALSDIGQPALSFEQYAQKIVELQLMFKAFEVEKGDKIALCGRNSSNWVISFMATITSGAAATTILHDFNSESIHTIVNHSEAKILFVGDAIWKRLDASQMPGLATVVSLEDFSILKAAKTEYADFDPATAFQKAYPDGLRRGALPIHSEQPEELVVLNYTSGTTSNPKGVMIPYRSLWANIRFGIDNIPFVKSGDGMVSMLPMAHMYGLAFEVILATCKGCHLHIINKVPSPNVLLGAFADAKPTLVIAVPLIIEKIIRNKVFPELRKQPVKTLLKLPVLKNIVYNKVRKQLVSVFGGKIIEVIVGGAPLSKEVGDFLTRIRFPYLVGYGMTECGPLITYIYWKQYKPGSCGKLVDRLVAEIDSPDPETIPGEILVKGEHVMTGYLKDESATRAAIDSNGWLHTGDLGVIDKVGNVFIKGRSKTMILGPSGQNIYPEEIEDKINALDIVEEALVIEEANNKLTALIFPSADYVSANNILDEDIKPTVARQIKEINRHLPLYSQIAKVEIRDSEFEKTPKRSIKRFLYQPKFQ